VSNALQMQLPALRMNHDGNFCKLPKTWINTRPWDEDNLPFVPGIVSQGSFDNPHHKKHILYLA
jgi:hypothetical protein